MPRHIRIGAAALLVVVTCTLAAAKAAATPLRSCSSADLRYPFQPGGPRAFGVFELRIAGGPCATAHRVAAAWMKQFAAYAATDPLGNPDIALSFTPRGMRRFQRLTAELAQRGAAVSGPDLSLNQHIVAVLDGQLLSVLYVDFRAHPNGISAVNGAQITGGFTPTTAQQLAREIAAPPLPASLERIDSATVTRRTG